MPLGSKDFFYIAELPESATASKCAEDNPCASIPFLYAAMVPLGLRECISHHVLY